MPIEVLGQTLVNGLFLGGVYSLVAIGLTLIYGVMVIINFAHGEFLMLGMYISFWAFTLFGIHPYLSILLAVLVLFILGALIQRGLIQPMLNAPLLNQILLTLGLSTLVMGLAQFFWRAEPRSILIPFASIGLRFGDLIFNLPRLIAFLASIVLTIALFLFLKKTRTGKAIRACSQNRVAAQLTGVNIKHIYMLTFGIGAALTGIAGVLLSPNFPMTPTIGQTFSITAFVVVVLGTMGNFMGAFIGGLIIGVAEAFGGLYLGSDVRQVVSMGIFILVLLLKPQGLFGRKA
ncbi:MAG: branched-chain amino acid ABC transporter permease [Chloroflexota bacterium]|jgi:branched-chain amino acid transport system permease protein